MTRFFTILSVVALLVMAPVVSSAATITLTPVYSGSFTASDPSDPTTINPAGIGTVPQFQHQIGEILEFDVYMHVNNLLANEQFFGVQFNVANNPNLKPVDPFSSGSDWYIPNTAKGFAPNSSTGPYRYRTFPNSGTSSAGTPLNSYNQYRGDTTTTTSTSLFNNAASDGTLNNIIAFVGRTGANGKIDVFNRDFGQVFNPATGQGLGEPDQLRAAGSADTLLGTFFMQFVNDDGSTTAGGAAHPGNLNVVPVFTDGNNSTWQTQINNTAAGGGTQQTYFGQNFNNAQAGGTFFGGSATVAPEPASFVLLGLGGVAMALVSRRRMKKA